MKPIEKGIRGQDSLQYKKLLQRGRKQSVLCILPALQSHRGVRSDSQKPDKAISNHNL